MSDEFRNGPADRPFLVAGPGSLVTRSCMGCSKSRMTRGGVGVGIRWRCVTCVTERKIRLKAA